MERLGRPLAVDEHRRDLGDAVARPRAHPRRLHVHDEEGNFTERRARVIRLTPPARFAPHHSPFAVRPLRSSPFALRPSLFALRSSLFAPVSPHHGSARTTGHVMHRGPPPPRTSSAPSNVMTARSSSAIRSCPVRNASESTRRKPAFAISPSVASLRE